MRSKYKVVATKYPYYPGWQIAKRKWYFFYFVKTGSVIYKYKEDAIYWMNLDHP